VTGEHITVPAGATEFTYACQLPPWMETARTCRVCVMGTATVKDDDGSEHRVSFGSVHQNEQMVAVVGPGRLALELDRAAVAPTTGGMAVVALRIRRDKDLAGPVRIELIAPPHVTGIAAEPVTIPAGADAGQLAIRVGASRSINMPLIVRATLAHGDQREVAEAKLEVIGDLD
jgi:hypothetical protein